MALFSGWLMDAIALSDGTVGGVAAVLADMPASAQPTHLKNVSRSERRKLYGEIVGEAFTTTCAVQAHLRNERELGRGAEEAYDDPEVQYLLSQFKRPAPQEEEEEQQQQPEEELAEEPQEEGEGEEGEEAAQEEAQEGDTGGDGAPRKTASQTADQTENKKEARRQDKWGQAPHRVPQSHPDLFRLLAPEREASEPPGADVPPGASPLVKVLLQFEGLTKELYLREEVVKSSPDKVMVTLRARAEELLRGEPLLCLEYSDTDGDACILSGRSANDALACAVPGDDGLRELHVTVRAAGDAKQGEE